MRMVELRGVLDPIQARIKKRYGAEKPVLQQRRCQEWAGGARREVG